MNTPKTISISLNTWKTIKSVFSKAAKFLTFSSLLHHTSPAPDGESGKSDGSISP